MVLVSGAIYTQQRTEVDMATNNSPSEDVFDLFPSAGGAAPAQPKKEAPQREVTESKDIFESFPTGEQQAATAPDYWEDLKSTAISKGIRGAAAIPGLPGDIASLVGGPNKYLPTTQDILGKIEKFGGEKVKKALEFESDIPVNRYIGSAIEFAPSALIPGGQARLGAKLFGAAGAGVGSQAVGEYLKDTPSEGTTTELGGRLAGAIAGGMAGSSAAGKIANVFRGAEDVAKDRTAVALAKDIASRNAKAAPGALAAGEIAPVAAAGPQTQQLVKGAASRAGDESLGAYNAAVDNFKKEGGQNVKDSVDRIFKRPVQAFDEMDAISQRVKDLNDVNYKRVMALPQAKAITDPALDKIVNRIPQSTVDDMLKEFKINGVDPATYGFAPVLDRAGNIKTYSLPAQGVGLRSWDEIKQGLDSSINKLYDPVTKAPKPGAESEVRSLMGLKSDLVKVLDNAVGDYKAIRFEASELYGARNAVEAGYKYYGDINAKNLNNIHKMVDQKLTPAQKQDFAYGYAAAYKDALSKNPMQALGVYGGNKGDYNIAKMRFALGDKNANQLLGTVNAEYLNSTLKALSGSPQGSSLGFGKGALGGYGAAVLGEAAMTGENMLQALTFTMSPGAIATAVLGGAARAAYTVRERRIAEQVLKLAADPAKAHELGRLVAQNKDAQSFLAKFYDTARRIPPVTGASQEAGQANGGRINRASGGRLTGIITAPMLVAAAERAKKGHGKATEPLLNQPDEAITRALAIANQHS